MTDRQPVPIELPSSFSYHVLPEIEDFLRSRIRGRCEEALIALERGDRERARERFRAALEVDDDIPLVWLYLAALAKDAREQRDCLENVLAREPLNTVAVEALARLDGHLDAPAPPAQGKHLEPDEVTGQRLQCPQCGGWLDYHLGSREVRCRQCGYLILDADDLARRAPQTNLQLGMLRRKHRAVVWNIGQRWLHCQSCGAHITVSRRTLTPVCRFCGSRQVVQQGVNIQFEQPDVIVPFAIDEAGARESLDQAQRSGLRAITRFFTDPVDRIALWGVYLPFWVFEAEVTVNWSWSNASAHGQHPVLLGDVPYCASPTLPRKLLDKLDPYHLGSAVDYDPRLLADFPAELYQLDVPDAAIGVRSKLGRLAMRQAQPSLNIQRPTQHYGSDDSPGRLKMNTSTGYMSYQLALLPVWVAWLVEQDDDRRLALVNGQTGEAALGRVQKAR